jgi:hypothetical protein
VPFAALPTPVAVKIASLIASTALSGEMLRFRDQDTFWKAK